MGLHLPIGSLSFLRTLAFESLAYPDLWPLSTLSLVPCTKGLGCPYLPFRGEGVFTAGRDPKGP